MVATNEKVQFDFNADFGDSNYKSCFARSVVVNSQFQTKSLDIRQLQRVYKDEQDKRTNTGNNSVCMEPAAAVPSEVIRLRKVSNSFDVFPKVCSCLVLKCQRAFAVSILLYVNCFNGKSGSPVLNLENFMGISRFLKVTCMFE